MTTLVVISLHITKLTVLSTISSCNSIESRPTLQIERRDNDGRTAVMAAARTGKLRLLQELVARGADLGRQDD